MTPPWMWPTTSPKLVGTRVWRVYLRGGRSFTFGLWVGRDEAAAVEHAKQWGDVLCVEPVT